MGPARIYPWRKMHRSRAPSIAPGTFFVTQPWADCITNMAGFNLRQAQDFPAKSGGRFCQQMTIAQGREPPPSPSGTTRGEKTLVSGNVANYSSFVANYSRLEM